MTVVSFFCLFISLVLSTPYCFGAEPNHENGLENCTDNLNYPITFENWNEFIHQNLNSCILVLSTPCCFGSKPNNENDGEKQENCTDDLNSIAFANWDTFTEFIHQNLNSCISENITRSPKTPTTVNLSIELDRILNVDQSRNVIEISLLSNTVNIYRYKTIEGNGKTGVIPTTSKSFSLYRELPFFGELPI